ncbi:hypothetical protein DsansV1_C17g0144991 [Dioscorea sansibarensis]
MSCTNLDYLIPMFLHHVVLSSYTNSNKLIPMFLHHVVLSSYTNSNKLIPMFLHHSNSFIYVIQHNPSSSFFA